MCMPSAPKAPPPQPEKDEPRYMLSRDQFDELRDGSTGADPLMIRRPRRGGGGGRGDLSGLIQSGLGLAGGSAQGEMY